jgi:predicted PurR-regulated permease PerM
MLRTRQALQTIWNTTWVRVLVILLFAGLACYFMYHTRRIWFLFFLAWLLAYLFQPLLEWCEKRLRARWLGVIVFLLLVFLVLGFTSLLVVGLTQQARQFSQQLPQLIDRATLLFRTLPTDIQNLPFPAMVINLFNESYQSLGATLKDLTEKVIRGLEHFATDGALLGRVGVLVRDAVEGVALLVITLYLLLDLPRVEKSFLQAVPRSHQPLAKDLSAKLEHAVGGYFRGQLVVAFIVGIMVWLGLTVLGVPLALSLGFLAGILNLVPYLGPVSAFIPSALLAMSLGWFHVLGVVIVFIVANQLESHVLSPLILGRSTQLHPVTVILCILLGASVFGLWGAVATVPFTAFIKLLYTDYYLPSRFHEET